MTSATAKRIRRRRAAVWTVVAILALSLAAPFSGLLLTSEFARAETETANARSEYWREARKGAAGYSAVAGWDDPESGVLIQNGGQNWRQIRNGWIANYAPLMLGFVFRGAAAVSRAARAKQSFGASVGSAGFALASA